MRRMNSYSGKGLVAALEDENIAALPAGDPAVAIGDNAESLETDMIEAGEVAADVDALTAETQETSDAAAALESIAIVLGESAKNGGMDRYSAACVGVAVDALYKRVGVTKKSFPAMESFGQTSTRIGATKVALEDIKEQLKKIWAAIVAAIEKAIAWVVEFYNKVTDAAAKLGKRAEALKEKAAKVKGEAKEKELENERLAKLLGSSKGAANSEVISATVKQVESCVNGESAEDSVKGGEAVLASLDNADHVISTFKSEEVAKASGQEVSNPEAEGYEALAKNTKLQRSDELLGGAAMLVVTAKTGLAGQEAVEAYSHTRYSIGKFAPKKALEGKKLPVLATSAVAGLCDQVITLSKSLVKVREEGKKRDEIKKKLLDKAKKLAAAADKLGDTDDGKNLSAARTLAQTTARMADQPAATIAGYALSVGKGLLDYVEESLKAYSEKKEEPKPAEAAPAAAAAA